MFSILIIITRNLPLGNSCQQKKQGRVDSKKNSTTGKGKFDFDDGEGSAPVKVTESGKSLNEENIRKYDALFGKYLNTISRIEYNWQKLRNNEKNLNSAQKELSSIFHKYAKSVSKASVLSKGKFFFTEEITFENLEPDSKKEVIFGEYTEEHWLSSNPPGLTQISLTAIKTANSMHQV